MSCSDVHVEELETALQRMLPGMGVAVCAGEARAEFEEEQRAVASAINKRKQEFFLGRACARKALAALGVRAQAIPVGVGRQPTWPSGIRGSISHAADLAVAVACDDKRYLGVGIDLEEAVPIELAISKIILTANEFESLEHKPDALMWDKVYFSAKEAVYKCMYPLTGRFVEFGEVELAFSADRSTFRVVSYPEEREAYRSIEGLVYVGAFIVTTATLRAGARLGSES
jgi:4'-phosphopantetheinyl transferase EntD